MNHGGRGETADLVVDGFSSVSTVFGVVKELLICIVALLALVTGVQAKEAPPAADDPALEQRLMMLSAELRCLVCQNQSLADSHADLAVDLRNQIREQMRAGKSDAEIRSWLTQRYGDFVLYRPPVKSSTALLWFGPFVLLLGAVALLLGYLRRRRREVSRPALTDEERARAEALIRADSGGAS